MDPGPALAASQEAVEVGDTTVPIARMDWARFHEVCSAARPRSLLTELPVTAGRAAPDEAVPRDDPEAAPEPAESRFTALEPGERRAAILALIREQTAALLGYGDDTELSPTTPFRDIGYDSASGVQLRDRPAAATIKTTDVADDRLWVEAWRTITYAFFIGLFALLAARPRQAAGIWELALAGKTALVVFAVIVGDIPEARLAGTVDFALVVVVALAYVLSRGRQAWQPGTTDPPRQDTAVASGTRPSSPGPGLQAPVAG